MTVDLYDKRYYINRELSWLEFNQRCLDEAMNNKTPLLDRAKFLAICYNNLEEFMMIRMPGILVQTPSAVQNDPDYIERPVILGMIYEKIKSLYHGYEICWRRLKKNLAKNDINIRSIDELTDRQKDWVRDYYKKRVHTLLTPMALDVSHPFPFISNNSLNLAYKLKGNNGPVYARIKVPIPLLDRFVSVPSEHGADFVLIEDIILDSSECLFPGMKIISANTLTLIRNADVKVTIDEACDLMSAVEESIEDRQMGFPVAAVFDSRCPKDVRSFFIQNLKLSSMQVLTTKETMCLSSLWQIADLDCPSLKERPMTPYTHPDMQDDYDLFSAIKKEDRIVFHPYETFNTVVRFIEQSARDPDVQSIKICLYRVGKDPSIYRALEKAINNHKNVSVLLELRAKFDENRNIKWAKDLEEIGVNVVYGPVDLKVHSKLLQVVRLEDDRLVRYTHMSSGNYNVSTAKQYSDISFFTANDEIGEDVGELFNALTGYFGKREFKHLLVAPLNLNDTLIEKIDREIQVHKEHGNGHIMMKSNGLIDADIIASLYKASIAGVKVDLNIRGLCCLRPGIKGVSENIRVTSIVDRFLEHSRIYYFENNGNPDMFMGSSDLMPRNLKARVEVLYPVLDKDLMRRIRDKILLIHFADNVKARLLLPDGTYVHVLKDGRKPLRSQEWFIENRGIWHD